MWNDLIKIRDNKKTDSATKKNAEMFLRQLNTAGGIHLIGSECENFVDNNKHLIK